MLSRSAPVTALPHPGRGASDPTTVALAPVTDDEGQLRIGPGDALAASGSSGRSRSRPPARDLIACVRRVVNRAPARPPKGAMRSELTAPSRTTRIGHLQSRELAGSVARPGVKRRRYRSTPDAAVRAVPRLLLCLLLGSSWLAMEDDRQIGAAGLLHRRADGSRGCVGRRGWWLSSAELASRRSRHLGAAPRGRLQKQHSPKSLWPTVAPRARAQVGHRLAARRWLLRRDQGLRTERGCRSHKTLRPSQKVVGQVPDRRFVGREVEVPAKVVVYDRSFSDRERLLAIG